MLACIFVLSCLQAAEVVRVTLLVPKQWHIKYFGCPLFFSPLLAREKPFFRGAARMYVLRVSERRRVLERGENINERKKTHPT